MNHQAVFDFIDGSGRMLFTGLSELIGNDVIKEGTEAACNLLQENYELVFAVTTIWQFLSSPVLFSVSSSTGYWFYDKDIIVMGAGSLGGTYKCSSLFETSTAKCVTLIVAFLMNYLLDRAVATICLGFLAGCMVKRILINNLLQAAEVHSPYAGS